MSYFMQSCATSKGMPKFKYESKYLKKEQEQLQQTGCCGHKRSRLGCFMVWEFFAMAITVGLGLMFVYLLKENDDISLRGVIFFCKIVYGLLSFPFMIFAIPVLPQLLTKSKATRYDQ